jgi:hypothetical protein
LIIGLLLTASPGTPTIDAQAAHQGRAPFSLFGLLALPMHLERGGSSDLVSPEEAEHFDDQLTATSPVQPAWWSATKTMSLERRLSIS